MSGPERPSGRCMALSASHSRRLGSEERPGQRHRHPVVNSPDGPYLLCLHGSASHSRRLGSDEGRPGQHRPVVNGTEKGFVGWAHSFWIWQLHPTLIDSNSDDRARLWGRAHCGGPVASCPRDSFARHASISDTPPSGYSLPLFNLSVWLPLYGSPASASFQQLAVQVWAL